ncbi:MAG: ATP synthase F1 subunit epsilon [Cytophagales bacterium]|nr:ATP synthase F1 subunit epsilon [Cytophagales bacterium]
MYLEVITPDKRVFEGEIETVILPGAKGAFQVLKHHAPIVSALGKGKLIIRTSESEEELVYEVEGGVAEVLNDRLSVLVEALKS